MKGLTRRLDVGPGLFLVGWTGLDCKELVKLTDQVLMEPLMYYNTYLQCSMCLHSAMPFSEQSSCKRGH
jgi:hypothetical protein